MRTKTLVLSTLLGALGSVSVMAQTNVYSLNAVGYINVTMPPGYSIITCPLIASPDNTIATLLNGTNGQYGSGRSVAQVYAYINGVYSIDYASPGNTPSGWLNGGTNTINPGQAVFFYNPMSTNMTATFVGTVPSGSITNTLTPGYNLVGSAVPVSGDLVTNVISALPATGAGRTQDYVYIYAPGVGYGPQDSFNGTTWSAGDPTITNVYAGFFYYNAFSTNNLWVETYSVANP